MADTHTILRDRLEDAYDVRYTRLPDSAGRAVAWRHNGVRVLAVDDRCDAADLRAVADWATADG